MTELPEIDGLPSSALPGGGRRYELGDRIRDQVDVQAHWIEMPDLLERPFLICVFREKRSVGRFFPARDVEALKSVLETWGKQPDRNAPGGERAAIRGHYLSPLEQAIDRASPWYRPERRPPTDWGLQLLP